MAMKDRTVLLNVTMRLLEGFIFFCEDKQMMELFWNDRRHIDICYFFLGKTISNKQSIIHITEYITFTHFQSNHNTKIVSLDKHLQKLQCRFLCKGRLVNDQENKNNWCLKNYKILDWGPYNFCTKNFKLDKIKHS
jgi:hypothetical protein